VRERTIFLEWSVTVSILAREVGLTYAGRRLPRRAYGGKREAAIDPLPRPERRQTTAPRKD
jgi:hypothetical protein